MLAKQRGQPGSSKTEVEIDVAAHAGLPGREDASYFVGVADGVHNTRTDSALKQVGFQRLGLNRRQLACQQFRQRVAVGAFLRGHYQR